MRSHSVSAESISYVFLHHVIMKSISYESSDAQTNHCVYIINACFASLLDILCINNARRHVKAW